MAPTPLGDFLRRSRALVQPGDAGIRSIGRRRVDGLRRAGEDDRDRLGEVKSAGGRAQDRRGLAHVGQDERGRVLAAAGQQLPRVRLDVRVDVDIDDAGRGREPNLL